MFIIAALDPNLEAFIVFVIVFNISFDIGKEVHFSKRAKIAF